jgi:hypothetical protein
MNVTPPVAEQKRRPRAEIRQLVAEFVSSGIPAVEFCRNRGLSRSTLYHHLKGQSDKQNSVSMSSQLVRVELPSVSRSLPSQPGLTVVLARGRRIEVARGFDASTLEQLVSVLERL